MWIEFKNFFIKKLLSFEVDDNKNNLAANNRILHANMATLNKRLDTKLDAIRHNQQRFKASVPAMINTDATTVDTTLGTNLTQHDFQAYQAKMQRSMTNTITSVVANALKKNIFNTNGGGTLDNNNLGHCTTRGIWRKYKDWCHLCSENVRGCTSATCCRKLIHIESDTYENQQGGSTCMLECWMEWLGPDDQHYKNKSDYTGN